VGIVRAKLAVILLLATPAPALDRADPGRPTAHLLAPQGRPAQGCSAPAPEYPESRSLGDDAVSIAKVRIGNQRYESGHGGDGYQNHTRQIFTLHTGTREYMSLHPWYGVADEMPVYWRVWIDLNCDGDFDDVVGGAEELVAANPYAHRGSTVRGMFQMYFRVPPGSSDITTRMRISVKQKVADDTAAPAADEVFAVGEV